MKWRGFLLAVVALFLLLAGSVYLLRENLANYWIRTQLAGKLAVALGADVDLQGLDWKAGVLRAVRLRVAGGNLPFVRLEAREVRAMVDWQSLLEPTNAPLHVEAAEAEVVWRDRSPGDGSAGEQAKGTAATSPPLDLLVNRLHFRHRDLAAWSVEGSSVRALNRDGVWSLSGKGGELKLPERTPLAIERFSAEHRGDRWHIGGFALKDSRGGVIAGSATREGGAWSGEFSWQDLQLAPLLGENFAGHLTGGTASGDGRLKDGTLTGKMKIAGAETRAVGLFVKLAGLFDREDWSTVPWHIFRFDFVRQADGRIEFTDLQALTEKGVAVRGSGHYTPDSVGANLQLGVRRKGRPYLGAFVPILFSHERDGYCWTKVKVGGRPGALTEDLSGRVASALAMVPATGVMDSAVEVPEAAGQAVGDLLRSLLRH